MLHGLYLYPRATRSTVGSGIPHPSEATSGYDMAKSWSASIVGQARTRTVNSQWHPARKPTIGDSPLTLLSHMPIIRESVPPDHRTKRCRRGSEPIVYGSRLSTFAGVAIVAESEGYRFLGLKTRVRFSSKSFGIFFLSPLTPRKFHNQNVTPRRIKIISEMD